MSTVPFCASRRSWWWWWWSSWSWKGWWWWWWWWFLLLAFSVLTHILLLQQLPMGSLKDDTPIIPICLNFWIGTKVSVLDVQGRLQGMLPTFRRCKTPNKEIFWWIGDNVNHTGSILTFFMMILWFDFDDSDMSMIIQ